MRYSSTRSPGVAVSLSEAIERGIAPDGGLHVPLTFPTFDTRDFVGAEELADVGALLLEPFFREDALAPFLPEICREAFSFPTPLKQIGRGTGVLELFHGPTAAFKDVGARFLARSMARLPSVAAGGEETRGGGDATVPAPASGPLTILVATSGDTGGAVAAAFHGQPGIRVVILYPKGRISPRQEKQLTCWGGNVTSLSVRGDFDDCQRLVKAAFAADPPYRRLSSANSINIGRLLPQMTYYAAAALAYVREHGVAPGFIIPSGNLGNAVACLWAREAGLPIREVVLASNANRVVPDYFESGNWMPRAMVPTIANAMDVGAPSNMERLRHLFPDIRELRRVVSAHAVSDEEIRGQIRRGQAEWGETWDPHTAAAVEVRGRVEGSDWIIVATAHPAKFDQIVEPEIGHAVPVPPELARLLELPGRSVEVEPTLEGVYAALD